MTRIYKTLSAVVEVKMDQLDNFYVIPNKSFFSYEIKLGLIKYFIQEETWEY